MGKKVIIPRTTNNIHHQKTSKPFKPNKLDSNNSSLIKQVVPPKVYIIDKSSFKSKVQQLTGHVSTPALSPPPPETSPEIVDHAFFSDLYFHNQFSGVSEGTPSNSFSYSSMKDFVGYSLSDNSSREMAPAAFSDLYFDHHQVCGVSDPGTTTTTTSNSYSSSMEDFGYSYSPESLSSSLDCTPKVDQVYNNDLFCFDDLESWILDIGAPDEPEVSIYDYELSGLLS